MFIKNQEILKPDHLYAVSSQKISARGVVGFGLLISVNLTVQFDGEAFLRTVKIQNVIANTVLPPEFSPIEF